MMKRARKMNIPQRAAPEFGQEPAEDIEQFVGSRSKQTDSRAKKKTAKKESEVCRRVEIDPFREVFQIQTSDGHIRTYKLASVDETPGSGEEEEKMARLQRQLLQIQKKQINCQLQMRQEREKAAALQERVRELEELQKAHGSGTASQTQADGSELSQMPRGETEASQAPGAGTEASEMPGAGTEASEMPGNESQASQTQAEQGGVRLALPMSDATQLTTHHQLIAAAANFLEEPALSFFSHQIQRAGLQTEAVSWNSKVRKLSLEIYGRSPSAYQILQEVFTMPSVTDVQSWMDEDSAPKEEAMQIDATTADPEDPPSRLQDISARLLDRSASSVVDAACATENSGENSASPPTPEKEIIEQTVVVYLDQLQPPPTKKRK